MKQFFTLFLALLLLAGLPHQVRAQNGGVGIGTTAPSASAALEILSSSKGVLLPRLTQNARLAMGTGSVPTPAPGLLLFQTDGAQPGFWYNASTSAAPNWVRLTDSNGLNYDPNTGLQVGTGTVGSGAITNAPVGTDTGGNANPSPYYSSSGQDSRTAYLVQAADLLALGLRAGPITSLAFNITYKGSYAPFNNFTIRLANTTQTSVPSSFLTGTTTVFANNVTTVQGLNTHLFTTPFPWDGTSNLYIDICFDNLSNGGYDEVSAYVPTYTACRYAQAPSPCGITMGSVVNNTAVLYFSQPGGTAYVLPAGPGQVNQVLTQQASGNVAFQDPQWEQNGTSLYPSILSSNVGMGTSAPTQKLDLRGNLRLGDSNTNGVGSGNVIEFVSPGFNTDAMGLYRNNTVPNQSELRVVIGDDPAGNISSDRFVVGTTTANAEGQIATGSFTPQLTVRSDGRLATNGFVQMGANAPALKTLELSGTLPTTAGGQTLIGHGLTDGKIMSVTAMVPQGSSQVPPNFALNAGLLYGVYIDNGNVVVQAGSGATSVLGQPVRILIMYKE
jgi:hypothetical protein